jgi:hypothetical protein
MKTTISTMLAVAACVLATIPARAAYLGETVDEISGRLNARPFHSWVEKTDTKTWEASEWFYKEGIMMTAYFQGGHCMAINLDAQRHIPDDLVKQLLSSVFGYADWSWSDPDGMNVQLWHDKTRLVAYTMDS